MWYLISLTFPLREPDAVFFFLGALCFSTPLEFLWESSPHLSFSSLFSETLYQRCTILFFTYTHSFTWSSFFHFCVILKKSVKKGNIVFPCTSQTCSTSRMPLCLVMRSESVRYQAQKGCLCLMNTWLVEPLLWCKKIYDDLILMYKKLFIMVYIKGKSFTKM